MAKYKVLKNYLALFFIFITPALLFAQSQPAHQGDGGQELPLAGRDVKVVTYYPSPVGSFVELDTQMLKQTPIIYGSGSTQTWQDCNSVLEGMTYYGTDKQGQNKALYLCDGTNWVALTKPQTGGGQ